MNTAPNGANPDSRESPPASPNPDSGEPSRPPIEDPPLYHDDPNDPPAPPQPEPTAPDDPGMPDESIPNGPDPSPIDA